MLTMLGHIYISEKNKAHRHANGRIVSLICHLWLWPGHQTFLVDTFQFLSAYAEGKEQVSPSSEPQTVCDDLQKLVIIFLIQCRGEKK